MLSLNVTDPRVIKQQSMQFAYEKYVELRFNDPVGKDAFETATRIGDMFGIDPSFFIYCDDYGIEVTLEYFSKLQQREDELIRDRITEAFSNDEKKTCG